MRVFEEAKRVVAPERGRPNYGFCDVGDVLLNYLRNEVTEGVALCALRLLEQDYLKDPGYR